LKRLAAADLARLQPSLRRFALVRGHVLHHPGEPIEYVYFPISGMVSLLALMKTGEAVETAIIGNEGVLGASIRSDGAKAIGQAIVQIAGTAWQLPSAQFSELYRAHTTFSRLMDAAQDLMFLQAQQSAACQALHALEARLCRWLLHAQDACGGDVVTLTQEYISHMLAVRRTSVSLCANALQAAGLIEYKRGHIKVVNRDGLEDSACECYGVIREHIEALLADNVVVASRSP
jgi:CRP-like cAMP-binding protein